MRYKPHFQIEEKLKIIGIFGGTFDPVHRGHIYLAQQAAEFLGLQQIRFIPCYLPVHRAPPLANAIDRFEMLQLAIKNHPDFIVDDREIKRKGPSYIIDTLISLRKEFPETSFCLLLATDAFADFNHWHRWEEILDYTHLVIIQRPHYKEPLINKTFNKFITARKIKNKKLLQKKLGGYIFFTEIIGLPISGTQIRKKIAMGEKIPELLPPKVWEYIASKKLYGMVKD